MGTFETIGNYVTKSTDLFSNTTIVNTYMGQLKPVALIILTLFMLWRTIQIMSGSNQKPVNDTLIELLVWSIVWSLAFNVAGSVITNSNMITSSVNILLMTLFFSTLILVSVPLAKALSGSFKNIYNTNKASI